MSRSFDDLSQANPAVEAPPASTSSPDPMGTAVAPEGLPVEPVGAQITDPSQAGEFAPDFGEPDLDAAIPSTPPEGSNEAQRANWAALSESRDRHKATATAQAQRVAELEAQLNAFDGIVEDASKLASITRSPDVTPENVFEFEKTIYELNQPLFESLVEKHVKQFAAHFGYVPASSPDQPAAQTATGVQRAGQTPYQLPEALGVQYEYLVDAEPQAAAELEELLKKARLFDEQQQQNQQQNDRHQAEVAEDVAYNHDVQYVDHICGLFEKYGIPRTVAETNPRTGGEVVKPNPVLLSWIEDLVGRVEKHPVEGPILERSREAFSGKFGNQKAVIPELSAKVRAGITKVFAEDFAPRLQYQRQAVPATTLTPEQLRARAAATPPPTPGGATAPVPGQDGKLPKRERIRQIYAQHGLGR